jgi:CDP-diacylglycerol---serine O-phosphatidyltransferase
MPEATITSALVTRAKGLLMDQPKPARKRLSLRAMAPNIVTILALSAGLTGMKFALAGRFEMAVFAVVLAGVFDALDGSIARLLKSTSRFGAELDSLSDVVSFGVAPAIILYLWALDQLGGLGWVIALSFVVCQALRLARFNSNLDDDDEPRKQAGYLTGLPAPMGATLAFFPLILFFETESEIFRNPELVGLFTAIICFGMVSRIATFSFKRLVVEKHQMVPFLLFVGLLAASITVYGWATLAVIGIWYLASIPVTIWRFEKFKKSKNL